MVQELRQDVRLAIRRLARAKTFAIVVIGVLAAAMAANVTMVSVLDALVLRRLPVHDPGKLVVVSRVNPRGQVRWMSPALFDGIAKHQEVFTSLCGYAGGVVLTVEANGLLPVTVELVTGQYYSTLGVSAAVGRLIGEEDGPLTENPARVAVIAYDLWQQHFGGDPAVVGRALTLEGVSLTIVGVTPRGFSGLQVDVTPRVAVPIGLLGEVTGMLRAGPPQINYVVARLRAGVTTGQAEAQLAGVWPSVRQEAMPASLTAAERDEYSSMQLRVERLDRGFSSARKRYAGPLSLLVAVTGLLLVLATVNVAALFAARAASRREEYAVMAALGAGGARIARSMIAEAVLVTLAAGLLALPFIWLMSQGLANSLWTGLVPLTLPVTPGPRILVALAVVTLGQGAVIGLTAARAAVRGSPFRGGRSVVRSTSSWGRPLAVAQVSISLVLVFIAALLARSAANLLAQRPGVDQAQVLLVKLASRPGSANAVEAARYYPEMVETMAALPGVELVALSHLFPFVINEAPLMRTVGVWGRASQSQASALVDIVSPDFFATVGIRLIVGRQFAWTDTVATAAVAIVNESAARRFFGSDRALGERLVLRQSKKGESVEIVGVVADATMGNLRSREVPVVFRPSLQEPEYLLQPTINVRTAGHPGTVVSAIRRSVEARGSHYLLIARTLDEQLNAGIARERVLAGLSGLFAAIAVALAASGLYGLLAYSVTRRTRETGIRVALGAQRMTILAQFMREGLTLALIGVAVGIPCALLIGRATEAFLFGISNLDLTALLWTTVLLLGVGTMAGLVPAYRASRVDPVVALRTE